LKVMMLETSGWGGLCHYSHCLSQALSRAGVSVTLVTNEVYELRNREMDFDILTVLKDGGSYMERVRQLLGTLRDESPDILHIQSGFSARRDWLLLPRLKKHCGKMIVTAHNVLPHEESEKRAPGMAFSLGRIYNSCDRVVTHSGYSKDSLTKLFGLDRSKVEVLPHGNYMIFSGDSNGNGGNGGGGEGGGGSHVGVRPNLRSHDEILFFGHLRDYKGVDVLIRAFSRLRRQRENVFLVIAGKEQGTITEEYKRIISEEGVADSVIMKPGYVRSSDISSLFSNARVVVFPYRETDGSGAVQLAYSFGKPVIATTVGVLPEIVEEGINGFLVPPEDPDALAGAINRFLGLPRYEADKMGKMSKLLAEKLYGWDRIAEMTVNFYKSII